VDASPGVGGMKGYKGFNKDFKCRDKQYEVGKTYEEPEAKLCDRGLHFCEHPLDCFGYYAPNDSRFAEIEAEDVSDEKGDDSKRVAKRISIKSELSFKSIIDAAIKFTFARVTWNDEDKATGDLGAASATGDQGAASVKGQDSVALASGIEGRAAGSLGCWIVLAEWKKDENGDWHIKHVKSTQVDGEKIIPDTFYVLKNGRFVEAVNE
jgi:hypothetical protein